MSFSIAETAKLLAVEKELLKKWIYLFSDYLGSNVNPIKGTSRKFETNDIRVLSYVSLYWEDDPDIECIKLGLNSNTHYDIGLIDDFIAEITPMFIEPPSEMNEDWTHGVIFQGFSPFADTFMLADSYKLAGDRLIEIALKNDEQLDLYSPALYNYRHATELYIKAVLVNYDFTHDLMFLLTELKKLIKLKFDIDIPLWLENIIKVFNDFDSKGTTFRYGGEIENDEVFIDFNHLKKLMNCLAQSFRKIYNFN